MPGIENALRPCPFCSCAMAVKSNRDWHRAYGEHLEHCLLWSNDTLWPADEAGLQALVACWNGSQPVRRNSVFSEGIHDLLMNDPSVRMLYEVAERSGASREAMFESMVLQLAQERKHLADKLTNAARNDHFDDPTQNYFNALRRSKG